MFWSDTHRTREPIQPGRSAVAFDLTAIALGLVGFVGATLAALLGFGEILNFGRSSTAEEIAESRRLLGLAAVIAATVPMIGLLLAHWVRRRGVLIYFAVLLVFGSLFAGLVAVDAERNRQPDPVERGPRVCQEHSGGDNRCPGG